MPVADRFEFPVTEMRSRTVRGVAVNTVFLVLVEGVVLAQALVMTRLLGPELMGLYGIVAVTVVTLLDLRAVGVNEAFIQQSEPDQELEFQKAFTVELSISAFIGALILLLAPVAALLYGDSRLLPLMVATAYIPLAVAFQAPTWVYVRRMDFVRQRSILAVANMLTFVVSVTLAVAGLGVWSLIIGHFTGNVVSAGTAIATSPYRLRVRFERQAMRRYLSFSLPVFLTLLGSLVIVQGQVTAFGLVQGIAAAGFISVAGTLSRYADRADQIVGTTIYPALCAMQGRTAELTEVFLKSNRATMMWTLPFAGGLVLFAPDLVHFVMGSAWEPAIPLFQGLAVAAALSQVGFNWFTFYRAHGETRPTAVAAGYTTAAFVGVTVPALVVWGTWGFIAGRIFGVIVAILVRVYYLRRLLPTVRLHRLAARAMVPVLVATAAVVAVRLGAWGGERAPAQAVLEIVVFLGTYALATWRLERSLISEVRDAFGLARTAETAAGG